MKHLKLFFALFAMLTLGVGNAWSETITLNNLGEGLSSTSNTTLSTTVVGDYTLNYLQGKKQGNSILLAKGTDGGTSFISNKTPIPGAIQSVTVHINTGASGKTTYHCAFSTTECTSKYVTGSTAVNITGGNNHKYTCSVENASYFCVALGNNNNGQVLKLEIEYTPASSGGDVIVKTLKSIAVEGMTTNYETGDIFKFDGTCTATYSVTKNDVAQEDETKVVTPTSVSTPDMSTVGEQEVTVTYTENEVTVTDSYTIIVTENVITAGEYELALNNTFFGTTAAANVSAFPTSAKQDDITVTLNGAGTKTRTDADCVRMYDKNTLTFSVPEGYVINSIVFTAGGDWKGSITVDPGTYTEDTKTWAGSAQEVVFSFGAQNRIATATVTYAAAGDTPEVPTLDAPTFDLEEGTYNEAKEVTLSAEEGTIYYTLDGTTPDAESIEYTTPIVLDECGTTTIKAIAISGEITSSVASATYTIKLPLNNSQANPYTEDEAIEVYDGGCYDNQDVYVMGVVKTASYSSSYGNYTITLENGFQFYRFQKTAEEKFTSDDIAAGDTLVACGKLVKYGETYELGEGCYLVEHKPYSAPKVDISNTPETAYTVAEAIALIDDITSDLTKGVYVKGQISEVESFNDYYGSITYWIKDEEENTFQCYSGLGLNSEKFESVDDLVVGSQVVVYGTLKKHNSTYEFNYNNYIVSLTLPSYTVTVSVNDAAMGSVQDLAADGKYEHGTIATLTAVANDGYEFINWTVNDEEVSTDAEYTFEVLEDLNLVANFKTVEPEVPTALDNIDSTVTPVKAIVNGQLIIIKNGAQYNAQGQVIK